MLTNEEIIKKLNKFKDIAPDPSFVKTSRTLILAHKPHKRSGWSSLPFWGLAGALAILILIASISFFGLASPRPVLSSSFNPHDLEEEFKRLTINIQLEELKYRTKANQTIASALNEIKDTNVRHLNSFLLESEEESITIEESTNPEIDVLLEKVIF